MDLSRTTLIGLVGTTDRVGGAEKAFRAILNGCREALGLRLHVATHVQPEDPDPDFEPIVLRKKGEPAGLGMVRTFRHVLAEAPRPAILFPFQLRSNIIGVAANQTLPRALRLPTVLNDRASISQMLKAPSGASLSTRLSLQGLTIGARFAYGRADRIVCNSKANEREVCGFVGRNGPAVSTIYNPLDAKGLEARFPPRNRRALSDSTAPLITAHGRMDPQKGWDILLRAFARVSESIPEARLRIVGDGPNREELLGLARSLGVADRCEWPGFLADPITAIEEGDVYVLPSRWEGLPNALLEAIGVGLPTVATRCPTGPEEILEEGRVGRLVAVDDVEGLAVEVLGLLLDHDERARLGDLARRRALDFSLARNIASYKDIFESLLEVDH